MEEIERGRDWDCEGVRIGDGVGDGAFRAKNTSINGLKCIIVLTSKFKSSSAKLTTTSVACFLYSGESVLYIDVYVTRIKFCVLCGVRARSRWFLDRSVSCIESSDRPKTI